MKAENICCTGCCAWARGTESAARPPQTKVNRVDVPGANGLFGRHFVTQVTSDELLRDMHIESFTREIMCMIAWTYTGPPIQLLGLPSPNV